GLAHLQTAEFLYETRLWLLRCVGSARIHAASRIDVHEIYSFSITCQSLSSNLIKSLDIFAPNGAWCPLNLIKRPKWYEGARHVSHETIRHQTSQSQKTPSTQSPRTPPATARPGSALYRSHSSGPEGLGFSRHLGGRD